MSGDPFAQLAAALRDAADAIEQLPAAIDERARAAAALEPEQPERRITNTEAARLLSSTPERVRKLRSARKLTPYREGGRALNDRAEVEALIEPGLVGKGPNEGPEPPRSAGRRAA